MGHRPRHGFTLIELLVVVAIIVALLAILLPSMGRAMHVAQTAVCASNLHQIGVANLGYTGDNFTKFPDPYFWVVEPAGPTWAWKSWAAHDANNKPFVVTDGTLYPYMGGGTDAYVCPVFEGVYRSAPPHEITGHTYGSLVPAVSYSMNTYVKSTSNQGWNGIAIGTVSQVRQLAQWVVFSEENTWVVPGQSFYSINNNSISAGQYNNPTHLVDGLASFHYPLDHLATPLDGSSNAAFADGHVELVHVSQTKEALTPGDYK